SHTHTQTRTHTHAVSHKSQLDTQSHTQSHTHTLHPWGLIVWQMSRDGPAHYPPPPPPPPPLPFCPHPLLLVRLLLSPSIFVLQLSSRPTIPAALFYPFLSPPLSSSSLL